MATTTMTTIQALRFLQLNACTIDALLETTETDGLDHLPEEQIRTRLKATEVLFLSMGDQYFGEATFYEAWTARIADWWKRLETLTLLKKKLQKEKKEELCNCSSNSSPAFVSSTSSSTSLTSTSSNSTKNLVTKVQMVDASTSTFDDFEPTTSPNDQTKVNDPLQSHQSSLDITHSIESEAESEAEVEEKLGRELLPFKLKSTVKSQVEAGLSALPSLSSEGDIASLRTLLLALSSIIKDRRLNDNFRGKILSKYLLPKLPSPIVEQYRRSSGPWGGLGQLQKSGGFYNSRQPNKIALLRLRHHLGDHLLDIFTRSPKEGSKGQQLCLECITIGHRTADCRRVVCFRCKQPGHMRSGCPLPKNFPAITYSSSNSSFSSKGERKSSC